MVLDLNLNLYPQKSYSSLNIVWQYMMQRCKHLNDP